MSLERVRCSSEQRGALARQQLVEEHLSHEVVTKTEAGGGVDQEPLAAQFVERRPERRRVEIGRRLKHPPVDRRRQRRRSLDAAHGLCSERLSAREHDVTQARGKPSVTSAGGEQLLGEERIPPAPPREVPTR